MNTSSVFNNSEWSYFNESQNVLYNVEGIYERLFTSSILVDILRNLALCFVQDSCKQPLFLPAALQNRKVIKNIVDNNFHTITRAHQFGIHVFQRKAQFAQFGLKEITNEFSNNSICF